MASKNAPIKTAVRITEESEKQKALKTAIDQIEKQFGKGAVMRLGENVAMNVEHIKTGSLTLDVALYCDILEFSITDEIIEKVNKRMQEIVESDDAIIILEIGNSKLSDVYATATIITESETDYVDLREVASDKAVDLLCGTFGT